MLLESSFFFSFFFKFDNDSEGFLRVFLLSNVLLQQWSDGLKKCIFLTFNLYMNMRLIDVGRYQTKFACRPSLRS